MITNIHKNGRSYLSGHYITQIIIKWMEIASKQVYDNNKDVVAHDKKITRLTVVTAINSSDEYYQLRHK